MSTFAAVVVVVVVFVYCCIKIHITAYCNLSDEQINCRLHTYARYQQYMYTVVFMFASISFRM